MTSAPIAQSNPQSPSPNPQSLGWYLVGVGVGVAILSVWWVAARAPRVAVDLIAMRPAGGQVEELSIDGVTQKALSIGEPGQMAWTVTVPSGGWLRANLGVRQEAWSHEGTTLVFVVSVEQDGVNSELLRTPIDPFANAPDRQWVPVLLDLSAWAGQTVDLILAAHRAQTDANVSLSAALWGTPAVVVP